MIGQVARGSGILSCSSFMFIDSQPELVWKCLLESLVMKEGHDGIMFYK
jgi:hypothetical protein